MLRKIMLAGLVVAFAGGAAFAQDASCETKAVGKDGKALSGAAKTSSMKKPQVSRSAVRKGIRKK
jgi:type IV secretory pathway TrbL component